MNLVWFLTGIVGGVILYHNLIPWVVQKTGKSRDALAQFVRGLNHDAFTNLRWAVSEESKRRGIDDSQTN